MLNIKYFHFFHEIDFLSMTINEDQISVENSFHKKKITAISGPFAFLQKKIC